MLAQRVYYRPTPYDQPPPSAPMLQEQHEYQQTMNNHEHKEQSQVSQDSSVFIDVTLKYKFFMKS